MWLANDIPEEIWLYVVAIIIGCGLCDWLLAFLKKLDACAGQ